MNSRSQVYEVLPMISPFSFEGRLVDKEGNYLDTDGAVQVCYFEADEYYSVFVKDGAEWFYNPTQARNLKAGDTVLTGAARLLLITKIHGEKAVSETIPSKVTLAEVDASILHVDYIEPPHSTTTICLLTTNTGWPVEGTSGCIDPANFNAELGRAAAYKDAHSKLWSFLGYGRHLERHAAGLPGPADRGNEQVVHERVR